MSNRHGARPAQNAWRQAGTPSPTLIDSLIIIFVSAALIIFLFWVASRSLNVDTFDVLPDFLTKSFAGIWASAASGATGIGLAVYKGLTARDQPRPNYLLWIGGTSGTMFLLVFLLLYILRQLGPFAVVTPPWDAELINVNEDSVAQLVLDIRSDPVVRGLSFELKGRYSVHGRTVEGTVESGAIVVGNDFEALFETHVRSVSLGVCYAGKSRGDEVLQWFPDPMRPQETNSEFVDLTLTKETTQYLPPMKWRIDIPKQINTSKMWLCSALDFAAGEHGIGLYQGYQRAPFARQSGQQVEPAQPHAESSKNAPQPTVTHHPVAVEKKSATLYPFTLVLHNDTSVPQFYSDGQVIPPSSYRSGIAEFRLPAGSYNLRADYASWTCTAVVSLPLEHPGPISGDCKLK